MGAGGGETYGKLLTSSQAVGLLAVVAVSGSVALLTFRKQKLWPHLTSAASCPAHVCEEKLLPRSPSRPPEQVQEKYSIYSSRASSSDNEGRQPVMKKVRFAPDVVEPAGDGHEYRCRKRSVQKMNSKKEWSEEKAKDVESSEGGGSSSRFQSLAKPSLPANRMLLYNGMQRYKAHMALHCR